MSGLDEKSIWNENIILQHAYRIHLISKKSISYKDAQSLVRGLVQEYDLANGTNTEDRQLTMPDVINSRLSELEEENQLLKLIIENGLGAKDLENDCL